MCSPRRNQKAGTSVRILDIEGHRIWSTVCSNQHFSQQDPHFCHPNLSHKNRKKVRQWRMPSCGRNFYINTIFNTNIALQTHFWVVDHQLRNADLSSDYLHILTCVQTPQIFFFSKRIKSSPARVSISQCAASASRCSAVSCNPAAAPVMKLRLLPPECQPVG